MKGVKKVCSRGHTFVKSSLCPVCPICWPGQKKSLQGDLPVTLSAPALRALTNNGIRSLKKLSLYSTTEILALHGMGPSSIPKLRAALKKQGLTFKK